MGYTGEGILTADPLFVNANEGNYLLRDDSPAVDFGLTTFLPHDTFDLDGDGDTDEPLPYDLDGSPRVQGSSVDLGAYESSLPVSDEPTAGLPLRDELAPAYPNPARTHATFMLSLASPRETVRVEAFDLLGRRVAVLHDGPLAAGTHRLVLDGTGLPAGVYVVRSTANGFDETRRVVIIR